jgi:DNA helicase HerA-like ATPase
MYALGRSADATGPTGRLGHYRAADGTRGAPVEVDLDRPHAALVVGKRGSGKSHTLGVLAEAAAAAPGVAPVVVDPMGALGGLAAGAGRVVDPRVRADAVPARDWPALFGLDPAGGAGGLVWRAAAERATLDGMASFVGETDAAPAVCRAAANHLRLADSWGVFDPTGLGPTGLADGDAAVLDCAGLPDAAIGAVVAGVARALYDARVADRIERLPWLLVDEAHAFLNGGAADPALRTLLTRGRAPGVSLVAATQRPGALPAVARSQADLLVAHRLTAEPDVAALAAATPTYLDGTLRERLPSEPGAAVVVDDATESVHGVQVRERETPHGETPRASEPRGD